MEKEYSAFILCYVHQMNNHSGFEAKTSVSKLMKNVLCTQIFAPVLQLIFESCSYRALCPKIHFKLIAKIGQLYADWGPTINDVVPKLAIFEPLSCINIVFWYWVLCTKSQFGVPSLETTSFMDGPLPNQQHTNPLMTSFCLFLIVRQDILRTYKGLIDKM